MRDAFIEIMRQNGRWYEDDFTDMTPDGKYRDGDLEFYWNVYRAGANVPCAHMVDALQAMLIRFDDSHELFSARYACAKARAALSLYVAARS